MNLFIMSFEEILKLYTPQNEVEDYIISVMKQKPLVSIEEFDEVKSELEEARVEIIDLEEDIFNLGTEVEGLENKLRIWNVV